VAVDAGVTYVELPADAAFTAFLTRLTVDRLSPWERRWARHVREMQMDAESDRLRREKAAAERRTA
jgi:hypothetical protein